MANFFKGMVRANSTNYGDLEGPMTGIKRGKMQMPICIEKGKCLAWAVGANDVELSKETVKSVELVASNQVANDITGGQGKTYNINVYKITMKDGQVGTLRLLSGTEYKVLQLIK